MNFVSYKLLFFLDISQNNNKIDMFFSTSVSTF